MSNITEIQSEVRKQAQEREGFEMWFKKKATSGSGNIILCTVLGLLILAPITIACHFGNITYKNHKLRRQIFEMYGIEPWRLK